ncbi:MAG TPA: FkbM family methyltransferase [Fontimonas sp.]
MNPLRPLVRMMSSWPLVGPSIRRLRYEWKYRQLAYPKLVAAFARHFPDARFMQIGANDGEQLDPLRREILRREWHGVLVEPVPYVFKRLQRNYGGNPRLTLMNVAVAEKSGSLPFYHLREKGPDEQLPPWYDALGSFRKDVVLKHDKYIADIASRVVCAEVPCLSFEDLCARAGVKQLDMLQMDTEGYDYEIIRHIDFTRWRPALIIYEHLHFDAATQNACEGTLRAAGYQLHREVMDTWCIDARATDPQHAAWLADWNRIVSATPQSNPIDAGAVK